MLQKLRDSNLARHVLKTRKTLFRNLKSEKWRTVVDRKEQERLNLGILKAAQFGRTDRIGRLLKLGADIEARNNKSETAFVLAAIYGHTETCAFLLEKGADMYASNIYSKKFPSGDDWTAHREARLNRRTETVEFLDFANFALKRLNGIFADKKTRVSFFLRFRECISS
jgi:ankyrin repeat protein